MKGQSGLLVFGSVILGFDSRTCFVAFDVAPETKSERFIYVAPAYITYTTWRYAKYNYVLKIFTTRYTYIEYKGFPYDERKIKVLYGIKYIDERHCYYYFLHNEVKCYCEGLFTNTPLLLKNYKYNNWERIPNVITPEFYIWSFYPLDENSIELLIHNKTKDEYILLSSSTDKDKFKIEKVSNYVYKITVFVNEFFENGTVLDLYLSVYDIHGNYIKDGIW